MMGTNHRTEVRTATRAGVLVVAVVALVVATIAAVVPGLPAGASGVNGRACPDRELEQTFAPLLDPISYFPLPGGDFETVEGGRPAGWTLRGGAHVVDGVNQTLLDLPGSVDHSRALVLPPGAAAVAATVCVEGTAPVMRFFARPTGVLGLVTVTVRAIDESGDGQVLTSPVIALLPWWSAPMAAFRLPWLGDHLTQVTVELRSVGLSPVQVDDIYVDPLRQR